MDEGSPVLFDCGTSIVRAGFAGDDSPRCVFPTLVGKPLDLSKMPEYGEKKFYVGREIQEISELWSIQRPIERGVITNFESMVSPFVVALLILGKNMEVFL